MEKLKLVARYFLTIIALAVVSNVLALILDAHDFRVVIAVGLGMLLSSSVFDLTKKIPYIGE